MLEKVDLLKKLSKEEYKEKMSQLETKIGQLQRECKALKIPIMIVNTSVHPASCRLSGSLSKTIPSGDSGSKLRKRGESLFMTAAGTEEY